MDFIFGDVVLIGWFVGVGSEEWIVFVDMLLIVGSVIVNEVLLIGEFIL